MAGGLLTARARGRPGQQTRLAPQQLPPLLPNAQKPYALGRRVAVQVQNHTAARGSHRTDLWPIQCIHKCPEAALGNLKK